MKHLRNLFGAALMLLVTALTMVGCGNIDNPLEEIGNNSSSESTPTPPAFNAKGTPLTFEAAVANATITFTLEAGVNAPTYEMFSADGSLIESGTYSGPITLANVGDRVEFKGNNATYCPSNASKISCSKDCYIYGNIMSLLKADGFENETILPEHDTFNSLFVNNKKIKNLEGKALVLPATTLTEQCYSDMFRGCKGLTIAPELPATELKRACYLDMFTDCIGLTSAPELKATTLVSDCYNCMFEGCLNLNYVKCLATSKADGASNCTENWLYNVAASGTFAMDENSINWTPGGHGIPDGWTTSPALPTFVPKETPLTIEAATSDAAGINVSFANAAANPVYYSTDGGATWPEENKIGSNETKTIKLYDRGDRVMFKATNTVYFISESNKSNISCSDYCYVYGNIMSLIDATSFKTNTTLTADWAFCALFRDNTHIKNHPERTIALPATTLTEGCYASLFRDCNNLTVAPELPATILKTKCYFNMFSGCSQLTTAPELKAATLVKECYWEMFANCTKLNNIKCLATGDDGNSGFKGEWLSNVATTGTIVTSSANTNWQNTDTGSRWYYPSTWSKTTE